MPSAFVRVRVPIDEFVALRVVNVPVAADREPVVPIDPADRAFVITADAAEKAPPTPKAFVMFPEPAENAFVTPRDVKVEDPAENAPVTPRAPPIPKLFVMLPEAAENAFVTPKLFRIEAPAENAFETPKVPPISKLFVMLPEAAENAPPIPKAFVMNPEAAENALVTPREVKVEAPAENSPDTPKFPVRESVVFLSGVYPNAVVMSDDDIENVAVRFDSPSLVSVRVLWVACGVEKEIAVT